MEALLKSLAQHSTEILLVLVVVVFSLSLYTFVLARRQRRNADRWRQLLRNAHGDTLEELLREHLRERTLLERDLHSLRDRVTVLEERLATSKRHMGLVRFDAFEEVHGNQSFALALYDDQGNGAVVSSIVGRSDCRVYCKPLVSGRSERTLSQEEQRAIAEATTSGVKSIVSP